MAAKVKLTLRVATLGKRSGDEIEVNADQVDGLVANGLALRPKIAPKSDKD